MDALTAIWQRIPIAIRSVVIGLAVAAAGTFPWAWLAHANLQHYSAVPWGPMLMAAYLWAYWFYFTGRWAPVSTSATRRIRARANPLPAHVWSRAILAGILGLAAAIVLMRLISRLMVLPAERTGDLSVIPMVTLVSTIMMGALVAGVVEEIAYRGYMQAPIERRFGAPVAILVVGAIFGFAHGTHTEWTLTLMPYYLAVAATYGALASITDSILPSLVLHAGGDLLGAFQLIVGGRSVLGSNVSTRGAVPPGINARFWINLLVLIVIGCAAVWAYRRLTVAVARSRRENDSACPINAAAPAV
jgi:membrane protease YdiL (CAAX protease family)